MAPDGCCSYKHTLLLFSSSMTPTDFQRLPPRELTPQPYSQGQLARMSSTGEGCQLMSMDSFEVSGHAEVNI